jgi:tRNA A37 threonylcarbamoyladenosine synthetase subunit TsaC/SUA5/YrdC
VPAPPAFPSAVTAWPSFALELLTETVFRFEAPLAWTSATSSGTSSPTTLAT